MEAMMKKIFLLSLLMLSVFLNGCNSRNKAEDQASPTFISGVYTLYGTEGKIGILAPGGFKANVSNKYMWHFWGTKEELSQKQFKVEAIDLKTGEIHQALQIEKMSVWEYSGIGVGPLNGADASVPTNMKFLSSGNWKLNAYLGGHFFGSVVVEVS
jgi:hypothetical protein